MVALQRYTRVPSVAYSGTFQAQQRIFVAIGFALFGLMVGKAGLSVNQLTFPTTCRIKYRKHLKAVPPYDVN